jgi:hypothetical protein
VDAVLEVRRLGLGSLEVVRRRGHVAVAQGLGLTGPTPAQDIPAAVELRLDAL